MNHRRKYETVLVITAGLLLLWYFKRNNFLLYAALALGVLGMLIPKVASIIDLFWYKTALVMGRIMSPIVLGIFFFCILTPVALLRRLISRSDRLKLRNKYSTLWKERNHLFGPSDLENMW